MYCKKCGRQLRAEAKFCDHCGQAVNDFSQRGGTQRRTPQTRATGSSARTTASSASTRQRARSDYEKKQRLKREQERKQRQKNRKTIAFLILLAIVAAAILGFASYNATKRELNKENQNADSPQSVQSIDELLSTENPQGEETQKDADLVDDDAEVSGKESPSSTAKASKVSKSSSNTDSDDEGASLRQTRNFDDIAKECNIYRDDRMKNIRCPYPKSFEQGSKSNKNTVLSLIDPLNDGAMMISAESVSTGKSASAMMKEYADGVGGDIQTSRAGDGWYTLSFERNNKVNHRKAVIENGLCVYYDFSYDVDSSEKNSYEEYIEYIDYYIEDELVSLTEKDKAKE